MNGKTKLVALALLAMPLLQACDTSAAWEGTITDSAGVAIVTNTNTPLWRGDDAWTVTEDLRIGTVAGEPEYQFGQLAFLAVGDDGTIYVPDMQAQEIKVFDAQGTYVRTIGGPGGGPGELGQGAAFVLVAPNGELMVPDLGNRRVNRYGPDGEPVGSFSLSIEAGVPTLWAMDASGRLMAQLRGLNIPGMAALEEGDPIVVYDTTGMVVDTVALLPKGQMLAGMSEQQFAMTIFAPEPVWDLGSDGSIYYAMNDQFRVLVNDPQGNLVRIIRKDMPRKPVEESDQNAILRLLREQWETAGVPPAQIEQLMTGVGFAETYPAFGRFFIGPEETLWVQGIRSARDMAEAAGEEEVEFNPQDIGSPQWQVFDNQGRYLGIVEFPDGFQPVTFKSGHIYGIWTDELDVQYVMRLQVNLPADG